jgi:streptogrisin C
MIVRTLAAIALTLVPSLAAAQLAVPPRVQTAAEALALDGAEYARRRGVPLDEAIRRLDAQQDSVATTDRIRAIHAARLAGIAIEHDPVFRIVVLLTGEEPVADEILFAGGMAVPIVYRTGAAATQAQAVEAMRRHQPAIRALLPRAYGMGYDPRTGEIVMMVRRADADRLGRAELAARLAALTEVPVRLRLLDRPDEDLMAGGARVAGIEPESGRRQACTTGFVVTDGARTGIVTAAHCPDDLTYYGPDGSRVPLEFVGQWGARYQDVQIHVGGEAQRPHFYSDSAKTLLRPVTGWRNRASTRAGDSVCRRGETTGYSCSEVELTDYAPGGELCGGPCDPAWTVVTGPSCKGGDSGGPIFAGTTAFGIVKGGNYRPDGSCIFSFYMSTDYLPEGWTLLYE